MTAFALTQQLVAIAWQISWRLDHILSLAAKCQALGSSDFLLSPLVALLKRDPITMVVKVPNIILQGKAICGKQTTKTAPVAMAIKLPRSLPLLLRSPSKKTPSNEP